VALPRYLPDEVQEKGKGKYARAEPGEKGRKTLLYPIWSTPEADMADFGIGVGLYFSTMSALSLILLVAFGINVPNLMYFSSDEYSAETQESLRLSFRGSSICPDSTFEPCPTCTLEDWQKYPATYTRYAVSEMDSSLHFIKVNHCSIGETVGVFGYASLVFVAVAVYMMLIWLKHRTTKFDEAEQTAQDYSIVVDVSLPLVTLRVTLVSSISYFVSIFTVFDVV